MWESQSAFEDQTTEATLEDTSSQWQTALQTPNRLNQNNSTNLMQREPYGSSESEPQSDQVTELSNLQLTKEFKSLRKEFKSFRRDMRAFIRWWQTGTKPNRDLFLSPKKSSQVREALGSRNRIRPSKHANRPPSCQMKSSNMGKIQAHVKANFQNRKLLKKIINLTQLHGKKSQFSKISIWIENSNDSETTSGVFFTVKELTEAENQDGISIKWTHDFEKKFFVPRKRMIVRLMFTAKKLNAEKTTVALAIRVMDRLLADYQKFQIDDMEAMGSLLLLFLFQKMQKKSFTTYDSIDLRTIVGKYSLQLLATLKTVLLSPNHLDWALVVANQWNKLLTRLKVNHICMRNTAIRQPKQNSLLLPESNNRQSGINFESFHLIIQFLMLNHNSMSTQRTIVAAALIVLMSKKFNFGESHLVAEAFRENNNQELFKSGEILEVLKQFLETFLELGVIGLDQCVQIALKTSEQMETQQLSKFMTLNTILNGENQFQKSQTFHLTACDLYQRNEIAKGLFVAKTTEIKSETNIPTKEKSTRKK